MKQARGSEHASTAMAASYIYFVYVLSVSHVSGEREGQTKSEKVCARRGPILLFIFTVKRMDILARTVS